MSRRCPVIASTATALPEVVGRRGLLVDPDDVDGWAAAMQRAAATTRPRADAWASGATSGPASSPGSARSQALREAYDTALERMRAMNIVVLCPHFAPDVAPTGEVMTSIVTELAAARPPPARRHLAALVPPPRPRARLGRPARAPRADRVGHHHPRPPVPDRQAQHPGPGAWPSAGSRPWPRSRACCRGWRPTWCWPCRPPLTLGLAGWAVARARSAPFVFNIQDVFPDVAVELGPAHRAAASSPPPRGSSGPSTAGPTRSPCCPTTWPTTCGPSSSTGAPVGRAGGPVGRRAGQGPGDPELHRHRLDPPGPREQRLPGRARPDRQAGRDLRRATSGCPRRSTWCWPRPPPCGHEPDVAFVINGGGAARPTSSARARGIGQRALRRHAAQGAPARGAGRRRRPRGAAEAGPGRVQRARPSSTRCWRPVAPSWPASTPGPRWPAPSSGPGPGWPCRPRTPRPSPRPSSTCSTTPTRRRPWGPPGGGSSSPGRRRRWWPRPTRRCSRSSASGSRVRRRG